MSLSQSHEPRSKMATAVAAEALCERRKGEAQREGEGQGEGKELRKERRVWRWGRELEMGERRREEEREGEGGEYGGGEELTSG